MRAISRIDFPLADNSCMVLMVPLLIMATSLVSKINTSVAFLKGWVNSFLAFMGQLYLGFYRVGREADDEPGLFLIAFGIVEPYHPLVSVLALTGFLGLHGQDLQPVPFLYLD